MIQIIAVVFGLVALAGAFWSYNEGLRKEGEANARAEYLEQQKKAEEANTLKALEGERYATELLDKAEKKNRLLAAQAAAAQRQQREDSDARAKVDITYSLWREGALPDYVAERLRAATQSAAAEPDRSGLPSRSTVSPKPNISSLAGGQSHEPDTRRIRFILGLADEAGMGPSGPSERRLLGLADEAEMK